MNQDPYVYPGSPVLINKLGVKDFNLLQELEIKFADSRLKEGLPQGKLDYDHLKTIHQHLFQDLYEWAGQERTINISKGHSQFALCEYLMPSANKLFTSLKNEKFLTGLDQHTFSERAAFYFSELNALHPFREGNGRTNRIFFSELAEQAGYELKWYKTNHREFIQASIDSFHGDNSLLKKIFLVVANPLEKALSSEKNYDYFKSQKDTEQSISY